MKVMLVSSLYAPNGVGGAELVVQDLAEGLAEDDQCVVVTQGKKRDTRTINSVRVHYVPIANLYWPFDDRRHGGMHKAAWHALDSYNPLMGSELASMIAQESPDVVHTHSLTGFSVAAWRAAKRHHKPLVHTLHDQYLLCPKCTMFKGGNNCPRQCQGCRPYGIPRKRLSHLPDTVAGISRFVLERHKDHGLFDGVDQRVVYNACLLKPRPHNSTGGSRSRRRFRFGFLGRFHPTKGIEELIRAFTSLKPGSAELWLAGRGAPEYERQLRSRTDSRDDIHWLGYVRPEEFLPELDVLVVPSLWHEPAGRVVQEAFAFGLPVIASNRGGIPELVNRGAGWLFEPGERNALADSLKACINNRYQLDARAEGARLEAKRYALARMLDDYRSAYHYAINRCKR